MGRSVYEAFETSKSLESDGVVVDFGDFKFILARAGGSNRKFNAAVERRMRPHRRALQAGTLDPEVGDRIAAECFAEAVVLGWEGVTDRQGNPLPFTRENCVQLLLDLPDLFADLRTQATNLSNFLAAEREDMGKASPPTCDGS